jgi:hypothetical protein
MVTRLMGAVLLFLIPVTTWAADLPPGSVHLFC